MNSYHNLFREIKIKYSLTYTYLLFTILCTFLPINGHGLGQNTYVRTYYKNHPVFECIDQVCHNITRNPLVKSYNFSTTNCTISSVRSVGKSETNCYFKLGFDEWFNDDILCTPTQEFYLPITNEWRPAYQLRIHDKLVTENGVAIPITHIEFVEKSITVYTLEIKKTHNFFVGRHAVLTHNIALPVLGLGLTIPFGSGAIGGALGSCFFGPVSIIGTIAIGSLIGWGIKSFWEEDHVTNYKLTFNPHYFGTIFKQNNNQKDTSNRTQIPPPNQPSSNNTDPDDEDQDKSKIKVSETDSKHIFRNEEGHIPDTPENRQLLIAVVSDAKNFLGPDKYKTKWYAKITSTGQQIWAGIRDGVIRYGGINETPKTYNPETGLSRMHAIKYGK